MSHAKKIACSHPNVKEYLMESNPPQALCPDCDCLVTAPPGYLSPCERERKDARELLFWTGCTDKDVRDAKRALNHWKSLPTLTELQECDKKCGKTCGHREDILSVVQSYEEHAARDKKRYNE